MGGDRDPRHLPNDSVAKVEISSQTIDSQTTPPNPYHTPLVAAAVSPVGMYVALLALELMPNSHDDTYVVMFGNGQRTNFGQFPDGPDLDAFRSVALTMLARPDFQA